MFSIYNNHMDKENFNSSLAHKHDLHHTPRHILGQVTQNGEGLGDKILLSDNLSESFPQKAYTQSKESRDAKLQRVTGSHTSDLSKDNNDSYSYKKTDTVGAFQDVMGKLSFRITDSSRGNWRGNEKITPAANDSFAACTRSWSSSSTKDYYGVTAIQVGKDGTGSNTERTAAPYHLQPNTSILGRTDLLRSSSKSLRSYHSTPDCKSVFEDTSQPKVETSTSRARRNRLSGFPMRVPATTIAKYREEEEEEEKDSWFSSDIAPLSPEVKPEPIDCIQDSGLKECDAQSKEENTKLEEIKASDELQQKLKSEPCLEIDSKSTVSENLLTRLNSAPKTPVSSRTTTSQASSEDGCALNASQLRVLPQQVPVQPVSSDIKACDPARVTQPVHAHLQTPVMGQRRNCQTPASFMQPMHTPLPALMHSQMGYAFTPVATNGLTCYNPFSQMQPPPAQGASVITVNGRAYSVLSLLGKGGSSKVYQVYDMEKKLLLAIKRVKLEDADESTSMAYRNEITLLQQLQHSDRVIKLYDHEYNEETDCLYAVIEKGDTDLASLIRNYAKKGQITAEMIKFYWSEMLRAVAVIHKAGIIHSDLKPANFLLVSGKLKLIDFGIARSIQKDMTSVVKDAQEGTFNYMSPEAIQDTAQVPEVDDKGRRRPRIKINVKADVWSLGCILYNLVYGKTPFQHIPQPISKMQAITNSNHIIVFADIADKQLVDVMEKCLVRDPKQRHSIEQLLLHPYLASGRVQAPREASDSQPSSVGSVLKQLAAFTPRSLLRISQELTKILRQKQQTIETTSPPHTEDS